jgi:glycosyltransferase involved in cell wall biosynthesis
MRILTALTYYRPHISGLTIYTERLAKALVNLGHDVTILTSQFDPQTPYEERRDGVRIVRVPVLFRISKGVIMPTIGIHATKLVKDNDVVHLHLPQFDAAGIALRGRIYKKPTILTYHCDLKLPPGIFNRVANNAVHVMNHIAAKSAHRIVTYTDDFARHSPYTARYYDKVETILPPVILPDTTEEDIQHFASQNNHDARSPVIGMAARFAAEKGVEVLLEALPKVLQAYPNALVLYAGQYEDVMGEEEYANRLFPIVKEYQAKGQWRFLGVLNPPQMAEFYPNLDVLVVPSLNSTESFGLVQIEAMMNGVPVVASNLPGVRQPVSITKMGRIFNIGDAEGLAMALLSILQESEKYSGDPEAITIQFSPSNNAKAYEDLYKKILMEIH